MANAVVTDKLDATQLADMPTEQLLALGLTMDEIDTLRSIPPTKLSSMIPLVVAAGKAKANNIVERLPYVPEINTNGQRLCVYTDPKTGERCCNYGSKDLPVCNKHRDKAASLGTYFRSAKLRETYEAFANSPVKMSCDGEISLMRTMLATFLEKVNDDNINLEVLSAITIMSEKITNTIDKMAKLEKITPEQLNNLMVRVTEVASKYIVPEQLEAFAKDVEEMRLGSDKVVANYNFTLGEVIDDKPIQAVVHDFGSDGKDIQMTTKLREAERINIEKE